MKSAFEIWNDIPVKDPEDLGNQKVWIHKDKVKETIIRLCKTGYQTLDDNGYTFEDTIYDADSLKEEFLQEMGLDK